MGPVFADATIDAPRERVYAVLADLAMRPAFCDHFQTQFRLQRIESRGVGAAARFHVAIPRQHLWMETVIEKLEEPHMIRERGRGGRTDRISMGTAWELVENAGTMTDVRVSFWTEPEHFFDKLTDKVASSGWYERQLKRSLARLRDLIESGAPIEPLQVAGASPL